MPAKKRQPSAPSAEEMLRWMVTRGVHVKSYEFAWWLEENECDRDGYHEQVGESHKSWRAAILAAMKAERAEGGKSRGK